MKIRFQASGPDGEAELGSLFDWFSDDRALRGHVRVERIASGTPGRMGPGLEAVLTVLSTAAGVAQLPLSYLAWRHSRRPRPPIVLNVVGGDPAEVEELLRRLRGETGEDGAPGEDGP